MDELAHSSLLEESLAELLQWVEQQEIYDDQTSPETAWLPRLESIARRDGTVPLAAMYSDVFVHLEQLSSELGHLNNMVVRARRLLPPERFDAALGRAKLRRRLSPTEMADEPR